MNNNSSDSLYFMRASVHAVLLSQLSVPSFAIPLVILNERSNIEYTPTVDAFGKIDGFMPIEVQGKIIELKYELRVEMGQDEIYAFVDSEGNAVVDTKKGLISRISNSEDYIDSDLCKLNFYLFCGHHKRSQYYGKRVFDQKLQELDNKNSAARWFVSAFICLPIFREAAKMAAKRGIFISDESAYRAPKLIMLRPSIMSIAFEDHIFDDDTVDLSTLEKKMYRLLKFAEASTGIKFVLGYYVSSNDKINTNHDKNKSENSSEIYGIEIYTKQERRLAEILLLYINDVLQPNFFRDYVDKSSYANLAIDFLRDEIRIRHVGRVSRLKHVASIIPRLVQIAFPHQRGRVILELARVLGGEKEIADSISTVVSRSNQREIVETRFFINEFLIK